MTLDEVSFSFVVTAFLILERTLLHLLTRHCAPFYFVSMQMKTNASVQCVHFQVCAGTQLEVTLVTVLTDMPIREGKNLRVVKVGSILTLVV